MRQQTENLRVDYYVSKDFSSEYKGAAVQEVERDVEEVYVANVRNNCWKERQTSTCLYPNLYCDCWKEWQTSMDAHCLRST